MNRRNFLTVCAAAGGVGRASSRQTFTAGIVPAGHSTASGQIEGFWTRCDEIAELGFRHLEINDTRAGLAEHYLGRIQEFRSKIDRRKLALAGLALFSHMDKSGERQQLIDRHMLLGRFLGAIGGKYVTHMIAPGEILNESRDPSAYGSIDVGVWVNHANEIGRRLFEHWGIKLAYHPEQEGVRSGIYKRFLEAADPRFVGLVLDTGHIASGGADATEVCQRYQARIACVHLKDFSTVNAEGRQPRAGNVPLGSGTVDLKGVMAVLSKDGFAGYVMAESGGTNRFMRDYMVEVLRLETQ